MQKFSEKNLPVIKAGNYNYKDNKMPETNYYKQFNRENAQKLTAMLDELPDFCRDYFRSISSRTSALTRLNYAYDLRNFFEYLSAHKLSCPIHDITSPMMDTVTTSDIEKFLEYVSSYDRTVSYENKQITVEAENANCGKARKLSSIRALFKYLFKEEIIKSNVAALVDSPKIHDKAIIRLEPDEIANLLDEVEKGERLTTGQKRFHEATYKRDLALITLMLGTGIRISECVGLNINDIDFETNSFKVTRKGGNEVVLFINDEIANTLEAYLEQRLEIQAEEGDEDALFLSLQKKRITPRAVQNLVKKYSRIIAPLKKISPHKLRSTYGTALYHETSDIYLVADVLGHRDVNTTKKHYAAMSEDRRREAADKVKLRRDE